jgi:hypothetical protein
MLIQKIIAERLSDKLQIIMVPTDGRNFFASDVLRSAFAGVPASNNTDDGEGALLGARTSTDQGAPAPARKAMQNAKIK